CACVTHHHRQSTPNNTGDNMAGGGEGYRDCWAWQGTACRRAERRARPCRCCCRSCRNPAAGSEAHNGNNPGLSLLGFGLWQADTLASSSVTWLVRSCPVTQRTPCNPTEQLRTPTCTAGTLVVRTR